MRLGEYTREARGQQINAWEWLKGRTWSGISYAYTSNGLPAHAAVSQSRSETKGNPGIHETKGNPGIHPPAGLATEGAAGKRAATGTASNQTHAIDTPEQCGDRIVERVHELRAEQTTERTGDGCAQSRCRCGRDDQHETGRTLARRGTQHRLRSRNPSGHEKHGQSDWQRLPVAAQVPSDAAWWAMAAGFA